MRLLDWLGDSEARTRRAAYHCMASLLRWARQNQNLDGKVLIFLSRTFHDPDLLPSVQPNERLHNEQGWLSKVRNF